ncbi:MAG: GcrA family cell cycle regulator [Janthinobacterium lividum]
MSWTDERVDRLSTLWLEGRSASQIAAELGEGVSRNAVIGKVHRLGLSGRAVPPTADAAPPRIRDVPAPEPRVELAPVTEATAAPVAAAVETPAPAPVAVAEMAAVRRAAPAPITFDLPALRAKQEALIPVSDRVTILELNGSMCRWPIGDPTSAEFRFCGCRAMGTLPYCQDHARVAFQPVADRRRSDRMIRIA